MNQESKIIQLKPTDLWAVSLSEDATKCKISSSNWLCEWSGEWWPFLDLGKSKYEILGQVTKDTIDFDVSPYVQSSKAGLFKDYTCNFIVSGEEFKCLGFDESFYSLLSSNGIHFVNPLGEKPKAPNKGTMGRISKYLTLKERWQTAESNLAKKVVILKKL